MSIQSLSSAIPHIVARTSGSAQEDRSIGTLRPARTIEEGVQNADTAQAHRGATNLQEPRLEDVVREVNEFIKPINNSLQFSIDDDTGTTVVKVIDRDTDEVIKQIPSEEMLALAKAIGQLKGLLVKQQA
jgi:flagellar protein FlaG